MSEFDDKIFLVIGNGFDLHCGLSSKYIDYFNSRGYAEFCGLVDGMLANKDIKTAAEMADVILKNEKFNDKFWLVFFFCHSYAQPIAGHNWCDIEALLDDFLEGKDIFRYSNGQIHNKRYLPLNVNGYNKDDWASYLLTQLTIRGDFGSTSKSDKDFNDYLLNEVKKLEKDFGDYLKEKSNKPQYRINAKRLLEELSGILYSPTTTEIAWIDSFNYTNPFEDPRYEGKVRNIHGNTDNPIFGISINASSTADKPIKNEVYYFTKKSRQLSLGIQPIHGSINDMQEVLIYGHSLNEQDQAYFQALFDIMKLDDAGVPEPKLVFGYSVTGPKDDEKAALERTSKMVTDLFRRYETNKKNDNILQLLLFTGRIQFRLIA